MRYNSTNRRTKGGGVTASASSADAIAAEAIYQTRLIPHRSMTLRQAHVFILLFGAGTCALSVPFYILGAWPVVGFMGLDVLALYVALRVSFCSARAFESLGLTPFELRHRQEERLWPAAGAALRHLLAAARDGGGRGVRHAARAHRLARRARRDRRLSRRRTRRPSSPRSCPARWRWPSAGRSIPDAFSGGGARPRRAMMRA